MANFITGLRILLSLALLPCPAFSPVFWGLYGLAGLTDGIDGAVARKTHTASAFGEKWDTAADFVFVAVCLVKLLPAMDLPAWLCAWIAVIACIKARNVVVGLVRRGKLIAVHSTMNKITGGLLFVFPMTCPFIDLKYTAPVVCLAATVAAIREGAAP